MNWWEGYEIVTVVDNERPDAESSAMVMVTHDGVELARFFGEKAAEYANGFVALCIDPRNGTFTEGFVAGLALQNDTYFEIKASLGWLAKEHSKVIGKLGPADAEAVFREAREAGRKIIADGGERR